MPRPHLLPRSRPARARSSELTGATVWRELGRTSFAVLSYVTPDGRPRCSGVLCTAVGRRLYVATDPHSWKARHTRDGAEVAVTGPIRRGGLLSLVAPLPPATVSCHARVRLHPYGSLDIATVSPRLAARLPREPRTACLFELVPEGAFLTYGLGVPLQDMARPAVAQARVLIE